MSDRGVRFCAGRGSSSAIFRAKVADILDEFVAISDCIGSFQCSVISPRRAKPCSMPEGPARRLTYVSPLDYC